MLQCSTKVFSGKGHFEEFESTGGNKVQVRLGVLLDLLFEVRDQCGAGDCDCKDLSWIVVIK
jgi:hypothetical protein